MITPAAEHIQIVNEDNKPTETVTRGEMRRRNLIHRASYILVFNDRQELFIQKRTTTKDIYPGFWDVAAGGVVLAEEPYLLSAKRELEEELGISDALLEHHFDNYYSDNNNRVWGRIYTTVHNGPFTLQEEEIDHGLFMPLNDVLELSSREPFTPDGLDILYRLIGRKRTEPFFLHGLDSSPKGTKGQFFNRYFPEVNSPTFSGDLQNRLEQLCPLLEKRKNITLVGSSFGGLMACCYGIQQPEKIEKLVLLAPALNFDKYIAPEIPVNIPVTLYIGKNDDVCPPELVIPMAEKTFSHPKIHLVDDNHMLHKTFKQVNWNELLFKKATE